MDDIQQALTEELRKIDNDLRELKEKNREGEFLRQYTKKLDLEERAKALGFVAHFSSKKGWEFIPYVPKSKKLISELERETEEDQRIHENRPYTPFVRWIDTLPLEDGSGR